MLKELVAHLARLLLFSCGVVVFVSGDGIPKVSNVLTLNTGPKNTSFVMGIVIKIVLNTFPVCEVEIVKLILARWVTAGFNMSCENGLSLKCTTCLLSDVRCIMDNL